MALKLQFVFDTKDDCETEQAVKAACAALVARNVYYLTHNPQAPGIYNSGVRYKAEDGKELWCDVPTCIKKRQVDCEDLACWRAAELIVLGVDAWPYVACHRLENGRRLFHILVRYWDPETGELKEEDPSALLGMKGVA